jgi:enoyl-CoA hydratase/carnithine racemase
VLGATELKQLGLVNDVMSRERLLPRAWELAEMLNRQSPLVLRYTRMMLTEPLKPVARQPLGHGLALEGLAAVHESGGTVDYSWE